MQDNEPSTAELQALLQQARVDSRAYEPLITLASRRLYRLTRKMFRSYPRLQRWEQTDDVFQSAAMRLHRSLIQVKPPNVAAFWGLAATQIRRTLIDLARHHFGPEGAATHHQSDPAMADPALRASVLAGAAAPLGQPESLQQWTEFHENIDRLPPDEADVFCLVWYAGLPQKEVAEALGVSVPTVQRRWYAAQLKLYELLQGQSPAQNREP